MPNVKQKKKLNYKTVASEPRMVDGQMAVRTSFYQRELWKRVKGMFEVDCPRYWNTTYLLNNLIYSGFLVIGRTKAGVLPVRANPTGVNWMEFPTGAIATLPNLGDYEFTFGEDAEIVYLDRDIMGRWWTFSELVNIKAYELAAADAGIDVNIMNSRIAYIAEAESQGQAETIKSAYRRISNGEPLVVWKKGLGEMGSKGLQVFFGNVKQNFIAGDLQDVKRTIYQEFLTQLGIDNANAKKKERLITQEVESNADELENAVEIFKMTLKRTCGDVRKTFPELETFDIRLKYGKVKNDTAKSATAMGNASSERKSTG